MQNATLPKISIVMPVLNREDTIEKALRSVFDQNYKNLEMIIIDGGSTDKTVAIIESYRDKISYFHSKPDQGPADATNIGIKKTTGDLVAILMADDWYEPDVFAKIAASYLKKPDADMYTCGGRIVFYDDVSKQYKAKFTYASARKVDLTIHNICFDVTAALCSRFIKKSLYNRIGLYTPLDINNKYVLSNDKEFLLRAIFSQAKNQYVDYLGHTYYAHPQSSTFSNNYKNILRMCREHMDMTENFLQHYQLTRLQRWQLIHWYNDQLARIVWYKILEKDTDAAFSANREGFKKYPFLWPVLFGYTTVRIIGKKTGRFCRFLFSCDPVM